MKILAIQLYAGAFRVCALAKGDSGEECPTVDFLSELKQNNSPDFGQITRLLEWSKDRFIINPKQFKPIGCGLFEFRAYNGARLFAFRDRRELLLCANGYVKKKDDLSGSEVERAHRWRVDYFNAKTNNTLIFKDDE